MLALLLAAGMVAAPPVGATPQPVSVNPYANELFDRDPALKNWATQVYDTGHKGWLTTFEAQRALAAFKEIADGDHDGRVTVAEYEEAKRFIAARWALGN
ncbi:hypothetical protein HMF7854_03520 [Sphingomonas ginkgonis]|uniref:EF-hand domain-containing protein n=1 Tax=Sphingomonas ginkgonis TaxID=2315330 RepID=A0A429V7S2_9SPHN|nr:hypothetical protein [Sphingomonas ginkgonis]RST30000.1 hypothetical protein HMF7854_03520 [Sphingomonas ginkgonis]